MSFNNGTNVTITLEQQSLLFIQTIWSSALVAIAAATLNAATSILSLRIFFTKPPFKTSNVFVLVRCMLINELCGQAYHLCYNCWHFSHYVLSIAEVFPVPRRCFYVTCWQIYLLISASLFEAAISIDRLLCVACPIFYSRLHKRAYRWVVGACCSLGLMCLIWSLVFDTFSKSVLIYCSLRNSAGALWQYLIWYVLTAIGSATVVVYLAVLVTIKCKGRAMMMMKNRVSTKNGPEAGPSSGKNDPATATRKMLKKLTKVTALSTIVSFVLGPGQSTLTLIFKCCLPTLVLAVGQYLGSLLYSCSLLNFVAFSIFMTEFRKGLVDVFGAVKRLVRKIFSEATDGAKTSVALGIGNSQLMTTTMRN